MLLYPPVLMLANSLCYHAVHCSLVLYDGGMLVIAARGWHAASEAAAGAITRQHGLSYQLSGQSFLQVVACAVPSG